MTVLKLVSEHLPRELAAIVTGYAIREDWLPVINTIIDSMRERDHFYPLDLWHGDVRCYFTTTSSEDYTVVDGMVKGYVCFIEVPHVTFAGFDYGRCHE